MFVQNEDTIFKGSPTQKEIANAMNKLFKDRWARSFSYTKSKPTLMKNIDIEKSLPYVNNRKELAKYLTYLTRISIDMNTFCQSKTPTDIYMEVQHWESKGGYCIYMSALFYGLLIRNNIVDASNLSYYQGFYDFDIPKNDDRFAIARMMFNERQIGIHAWLTLKDSLIDLTASQNRTVFDFDFGKAPIILGKFPSGYNLFGFKESKDTLEAYWKRFADHKGMSVDEWFSMHEKACTAVFELEK